MRCIRCGRVRALHLVGGICPMGLSVTLDAGTVERARLTGHPRLLARVLAGEITGALESVQIDVVRVVDAQEYCPACGWLTVECTCSSPGVLLHSDEVEAEEAGIRAAMAVAAVVPDAAVPHV